MVGRRLPSEEDSALAVSRRPHHRRMLDRDEDEVQRQGETLRKDEDMNTR